jgi:cell filamentation protein
LGVRAKNLRDETERSEVKEAGRYDVLQLVEGQFEPGSRGRVLRNLVGIKSKREMDRVEAKEQLRALDELIKIYDRSHRFTAGDICRIHKMWLRGIYAWAGKYRQVNVTKGDFMFSAASQIPRLMQDLQTGPLRQFTPCRSSSAEDATRAISVVHTELVLIHPFREGNGRVARLLATLMALQAGLPPLDFGGLKGKTRKEYFAAIRAGLDRDYKPMEEIFNGVILRTLREYEKQ